MEPAFISKKREMSRNAKLSDVHANDGLITKRGLAVLCASLVSTDGVLSVPLQLGAKLLLSRAAVVCPGMESWNRQLVEDDPGSWRMSAGMLKLLSTIRILFQSKGNWSS